MGEKIKVVYLLLFRKDNTGIIFNNNYQEYSIGSIIICIYYMYGKSLCLNTQVFNIIYNSRFINSVGGFKNLFIDY